jgi:hypothetical protein
MYRVGGFRSAPNNPYLEAPILGDLYQIEVGEIEIDDDFTVGFASYPSASKVNETMEELGFRPGVDVLKFVDVDRGYIPVFEYTYHQTRKEFPQATNYELFHHDRNHDHAFGALLLPPHTLDGLQKVAEKSITSEEVIAAGRLFDVVTAVHGKVARRYVDSEGKRLGLDVIYPKNNRSDYKRLMSPSASNLILFRTLGCGSAIKEHLEDVTGRVAKFKAGKGLEELASR